MSIRDARFPDDAALVRELFEEYARGLGVDLCFQGFAQELADLPGCYSSPQGGVWLSEVDGATAGCVALRPISAGRGEIKRLYVRPSYRSAGVGRALAEHALAAAARLGYERVCLDTLPSMTSAVALYRALGFVAVEPYRDNPVPGALFFERPLR
jgi:ribosomal protein S18 acetylase RimI-like enzyme